jgi:hypothetical protein
LKQEKHPEQHQGGIMRRTRALVPLFVLCASLPAAAQTTLTPQISGNTVTASVLLPGGIDLDLTMTFEQVIGLNANALSLTVGLVSPTDPSIVSRFPDPTSIAIPGAFPVLLRIEPVAGSGLTFSGVYKLALHTHALTLVTNSPLRLFKSSGGGPFRDVTTSLDAGSARPGQTDGHMSEFLVVSDARPINGVIAGKFDALQNLLAANASAINSAVYSDLQQRLGQARAYYSQGATTSAISAVAGFSDQVKQQSGANIPDVWQAGGNLVNVAGELRGAADTLKFSLTWKSNGAQ